MELDLATSISTIKYQEHSYQLKHLKQIVVIYGMRHNSMFRICQSQLRETLGWMRVRNVRKFMRVSDQNISKLKQRLSLNQFSVVQFRMRIFMLHSRRKSRIRFK